LFIAACGGVVMVRELTVVQTPAECCVPLAGSEMTDDDAAATATVFKALGDPNRVRIVNLLATAGDPVCVCNLTPQLDLSQPTVSFHLKKLVEAGLLEREQRGVWAYYSVNREALGRLETVFRMQETEMEEARP
jgi:ArsR family transcriptional regulator, arsenate/arsenite/antimonite-responsive transcriptional repressor